MKRIFIAFVLISFFVKTTLNHSILMNFEFLQIVFWSKMTGLYVFSVSKKTESLKSIFWTINEDLGN